MNNDRIVLRTIQESDYQHLIDISYYDGIPAKNIHDVKVMNEKIIRDAEEGNSFHWIICSKSDQMVLGTCGFYRGFHHSVGEIGYVLKASAQGKGVMGEAVALMKEFGWETLKLKSIVAFTAKENQASINVLLKQHFVRVKSDGEELKFEIKNPNASAY